MININIKKPARPATPEIHEEWTSERIRESFGGDPDCLVIKLLDLCEEQSTEITALKSRIRECEKDFVSYSQNHDKNSEEISRLQRQLADCSQLHKETKEKVLQAVGMHEIKKN